MSTDDYAKLSTDELIRKFVDTAKTTGNVFALKPRLRKEGLLQAVLALHAGYSGARVAAMQALGAELRNRKPVAALRRLFEHQDPDVRGWAGAQFHSVDPEWADATVDGLFYNLTAREVLDWRRRILQRPSRKPALHDMTVSQLVESFVDACERCYGATRFLSDAEGGGPSMRAHNKVSGDIYAAAKELNRRGELRALAPLLKHPLITVRQRAAGYCLPIATKEATATLEEVAATRQLPESSSASWTLDFWRNGQYCAFPEDPKQIRI